MANPSLQIGNSKWAIKKDNLLGYSTAGTRFFPIPITMTRASAGTRVNPQGLVETVELFGSEEVTNGNFATDSDWTKQAGWTISGGLALRSSGESINSALQQSINIVSGKTYLVSYERTYISGGGQTNLFSEFITDGVNITLGIYNDTIQETVTVTGTFTPTYSGTMILRIYGIGTFNGTIDNVSVKEYQANDLARVDYTGSTSSLLAEPQRTNEVTYSEDFSNAYFQKIRSTISTDQISSPDGTQNADKFIEDSSLGTKLLWTQDYVVSIGDSLTWSVFAKKGERDWIVLQESNAGNFYAFFDLDNGVIGTTSGVDSSKIEDLGSGWYRCSITYTTTGTTAKGRLYLADSDNSQSYQGNGTSGLYIWAAQLESGSFPTSYIPTSGSTVTRVQDQYTKTGISDKINSEEGVLFVEMATLTSLVPSNNWLTITDGTISNSIGIVFETTGTTTARIEVGGVVQAYIAIAGDYSISRKLAFKWKANDFAFWINGVEVGSDISGATPSSGVLNSMQLNYGAGGNYTHGNIKQLQVFKTALTDSELIALTTI